jgi:hypothetical protein
MVIHGIETLVLTIAPEHAQVPSFLITHAVNANAELVHQVVSHHRFLIQLLVNASVQLTCKNLLAMIEQSRDGTQPSVFLNASLTCRQFPRKVTHGIQTLVLMTAPEHAQVLLFLTDHAVNANVV